MYTRQSPYFAHIKERHTLTAPTSTKQTVHITLDASLSFNVGDSIAVLAQNDPSEVSEILSLLGSSSPDLVSLLTHKANLTRVTASFLKAHAPHLPTTSDFLQSHTLLDLLHLHHIRPSPDALASSLLPLMPRFYSIANSSRVFPSEIHLTVTYVEYTAHNRLRRGVGSHFLCNLAQIHSTPIPIYLQPSHGFNLPQDPNTSLIFVGPGTGIAPFRAFMQERIATQALGRNWLFFGERNRSTDFLYGDYWLELEAQERLRLDLAFSRDTDQKIYVQHRMYEERKSLWDWLQNGAHFYVCGDASRMAKDVDAMLRAIAEEEGKLDPDSVKAWIKRLRQEKRYCTDVY